MTSNTAIVFLAFLLFPVWSEAEELATASRIVFPADTRAVMVEMVREAPPPCR